MRTMVHFSDSGRPLPRAIVREGTWLRRKARSLLGAKLAAEIDSSDVAQELQLRALEQADRLHFANRQAFRGWL